MMTRKAEGFILILTLCMLSIFSILILAVLRNTAVHFQHINALNRYIQERYRMESLAHEIMKDFPKSCTLDEQEVNQRVHLQGCERLSEGHHYDFWIEDLGVLPCLQIQQKKRLLASHHYRLTLRGNSILQLRFISGEEEATCDRAEPIIVQQGVVSSRFISREQK